LIRHDLNYSCFPHVINIAVKTALSRLGKVELDEGDDDYADALAKDLVGCARKLVNACRASGKHRDALRDAIINIQKVQSDNNETRQMRAIVLLRDVDTRWSSTFLMIDCLLELYPAVKTFASHNGNADLQALLLSQFDLGVLADIRQFLKAFHLVQELASAQKTLS
ncbi:uncharacterized protein C8R40DRAFT_1062037, partial [Lentinula edodes]|uniref:uncharacterized protein n=1 Tax=Lentinula edodes TaxID=5353 RepID=UPI001E8E4949